MKLALIQEKQNSLYQFKEASLHFEREELQKLQGEMIEQNLKLLREAAENKADIAVTSEAINFPGPPSSHTESTKELVEATQDDLLRQCSQIAVEGKMYLIVGMLRVEEDGNLYNSAVAFDRNGRELLVYHKNFLAGDEKEYLTPGNGFPVWESEFGRIGIGICWDMQFPETARHYANQETDLLLCPTWGWEAIYGRSRAYENGIYVAAAMAVPSWKDIEGKRTPSEVVAPDGQVIVSGSAKSAEVVYCILEDIRSCRGQRNLRIGDLNKWVEGQRHRR